MEIQAISAAKRPFHQHHFHRKVTYRTNKHTETETNTNPQREVGEKQREVTKLTFRNMSYTSDRTIKSSGILPNVIQSHALLYLIDTIPFALDNPSKFVYNSPLFLGCYWPVSVYKGPDRGVWFLIDVKMCLVSQQASANTLWITGSNLFESIWCRAVLLSLFLTHALTAAAAQDYWAKT